MTAAKASIPSDEELAHLTTRAVAEIVPYQEFVDGLRSGRPLRLKQGFDPTRPVITLGWAVGMRKLRRLQNLGHTVVVVIGDWTARIGDPSGKSETRPMLSEEEVKANSDAILRQFYKVLDPDRTEIRRQSEWFDAFTLTDIVRLAARFTVAQMLQRDDFAQRFQEHAAIGVHELLYPLLQGYDSVAIQADVEFGGTDQKFNNLLGRELQRMMGQKAGPAGQGQAVFLVPLLVGLDGSKKMSQSLGNYIAIDDPPHEMYGKLMSIPDSLMLDYFELLTDVPDEELAFIRKSIDERSANPMEHKMRLAREIVAQFHTELAAKDAESEFERVFRKRELPAPKILTKGELHLRGLGEEKSEDTLRLASATIALPGGEYPLAKIIHQSQLAPSATEARRLIEQGAVEINGERVTDQTANLEPGDIIRVGKHRFLRIVDADKDRSTDG